MEEIHCQSCGMPMRAEEEFGTEADGTRCAEYCAYCYEQGAFAQEMTMEEMIEHCAAYVDEWEPKVSREEAVAMMREFFPSLKRWRQ